jgi:NTP pyrophosphatase (non-canonical NTP hydrolase)
MRTFEEYQTIATRTPLALRNNRDRLNLSVLGLQAEAGKVGSLLASAFASGKLELTQAQTTQLQDRLADVLWHVALLCAEAGLPMQDVAAHSLARLQARAKALHPDQR